MITGQLSLSALQLHCLEQGQCFVSFKLPNSALPSTYLGTVQEIGSMHDLSLSAGFVMAPFSEEQSPVLQLQPHTIVHGWMVDETQSKSIEVLLKEELRANDTRPFAHSNLTQEAKGSSIISASEYAEQVEQIRSFIRSGRVEKVVLSRIKSMQGINLRLLPSLFEQLCNEYPQAFVYLFNTPGSGTWMGATPETLVRVQQDRFSTMALAGTRAYEGHGMAEWSEKEVREQAHVLHYIQQKLGSAGFPFHESSLQTIRAGLVVHLRSMFTGMLKHGPSDWREIVRVLFPTPAVCGAEEHLALSVIRELEQHSREYYCGFLGPYSDDGNTDIFVNLRCMKVMDETAYLYAGGGILAESDPQREWEETELKFRTLIDVIEKIIQTDK